MAKYPSEGIILEKWGRKIFWIVQDPIFVYFQYKYRLNKMSYNEKHSTVFSLYDLKRKGDRLILSGTRTFSSTIDDLFDAFRKNDAIPPVGEFMKRLEGKIKKDLKIGLRLDVDGNFSE